MRTERKKQMHYVIDKDRKYVTHQGDESSCREFINNVGYLHGFPRTRFHIVKGSKEVKSFLKTL